MEEEIRGTNLSMLEIKKSKFVHQQGRSIQIDENHLKRNPNKHVMEKPFQID